MGDPIGAYINSEASKDAASQAAEAQTEALRTVLGSGRLAASLYDNRLLGGNTNYNLLQYLLTGAMPGGEGLTDAEKERMEFDKNEMNYWSWSNPGAVQQWGNDLIALQQKQDQAKAAQSAYDAAKASGMAGGSLLNKLTTPFDYDISKDTNFANAANLSNDMTPDVNSGHQYSSCRRSPLGIELP